MAKLINLKVVTPRKIVFEGDVENFSVPGVLGPFQVLYDHAPIVAELTKGTFKYRSTSGEEHRFTIAGGFLELHKNVANVLADDVVE